MGAFGALNSPQCFNTMDWAMQPINTCYHYKGIFWGPGPIWSYLTPDKKSKTFQVNSASHPSEVAKSSTSFSRGKGGNVTSAGWQITQCDPIWHVSYHNSEAKLLLTAICLLLTLPLLSLPRLLPLLWSYLLQHIWAQCVSKTLEIYKFLCWFATIPTVSMKTQYLSHNIGLILFHC